MKNDFIDNRDDQALEAKKKFQGTKGVWEPMDNLVVSHYRDWVISVCHAELKADRDLIVQAKPLLVWAIKHREALIVENLGIGHIDKGHFDRQIDELTDLINKALGHKENDGI